VNWSYLTRGYFTQTLKIYYDLNPHRIAEFAHLSGSSHSPAVVKFVLDLSKKHSIGAVQDRIYQLLTSTRPEMQEAVENIRRAISPEEWRELKTRARVQTYTPYILSGGTIAIAVLTIQALGILHRWSL
jgi:hypothetical protein